MSKRKDLIHFDKGQIVIAGWLSQSISKTAKVVQGRTSGEPVTGSWAPKAHWCMWEAKASPSGPIPQKSYCSTNCWESMLAMIDRCQNMLTSVHRWKHLQWAREHQNWTMEQWKKVAWSDESCFLLHHVDSRLATVVDVTSVTQCWDRHQLHYLPIVHTIVFLFFIQIKPIQLNLVYQHPHSSNENFNLRTTHWLQPEAHRH